MDKDVYEEQQEWTHGVLSMVDAMCPLSGTTFVAGGRCIWPCALGMEKKRKYFPIQKVHHPESHRRYGIKSQTQLSGILCRSYCHGNCRMRRWVLKQTQNNTTWKYSSPYTNSILAANGSVHVAKWIVAANGIMAAERHGSVHLVNASANIADTSYV